MKVSDLSDLDRVDESSSTAEYGPINPIATFKDQNGETRIIHRPKGRHLRVFCGEGTPSIKMNRAAATIIGQRVKERRKHLGLSQRDLCERAGFVDQNPKQRINAIESARRKQGVRIGTLYALAHALECSVGDLLPCLDEVLKESGLSIKTIETIG